MPAEAFALLVFFIGVAIVVGAIAAWVIGPRRPLAAVLPIVAAFGALYLVGHKLALDLGPMVPLFGFEVALAWDIIVAVVAAILVALVQRAMLRRRQAT